MTWCQGKASTHLKIEIAEIMAIGGSYFMENSFTMVSVTFTEVPARTLLIQPTIGISEAYQPLCYYD